MNDVLVNASLLAIIPQSSQIHTLRLDVSLPFKPGQSLQITFPGDPKKRHYSISSSPTEGAYVEITVKSEAGSALEKALEGLKTGDTLEIAGPMGGSLSLPDPIQESLAFIAAGTGVTPFRSMIHYLIDRNVPVDFWLFHSVRAQTDLLFALHFGTWSATHKNFHYVPTITRDFDATWKNETGRINETLVRKHITAHPCTYLLCGPAAFVSDMERTLLENLQVPAEKIRREKW